MVSFHGTATLLMTALTAALMGASLPAHAESGRLLVPTLKVLAATPEKSQASMLEWDGVIQAVRQSTVAAQVPGNITALLVKAGDKVKAGQPLARVDERDTQAALARSQAELAQADAQLTNARLQWQRSQALKAQGFISDAALDSAQAQWRAAQATVDASQAARNQAVLARGFATVVAPFDGQVLSTQADVGDLATPGRPILTLYAPQAMRAVVQVPASQAERVRTATVAEVLLLTGSSPTNSTASPQWVRARQVTALPATDPVAQTVEWRLDLPGTQALPGQTVRVRFTGVAAKSGLQAGLRDVRTNGVDVPASALLRRGELTAVYVVREGRFMLQAVRVASANEAASTVTVLSGLRAGELIATDALKAGLANASPVKP